LAQFEVGSRQKVAEETYGTGFDFSLVGLSLVGVSLIELILERDEFELISKVGIGVFLARLQKRAIDESSSGQLE
jgi:hypothetical protein